MSKEQTRTSKYRKKRREIVKTSGDDFDTTMSFENGHHAGDVEVISSEDRERIAKLNQSTVSISYDELVGSYNKYAKEKGIKETEQEDNYLKIQNRRKLYIILLIIAACLVITALVICCVYLFK